MVIKLEIGRFKDMGKKGKGHWLLNALARVFTGKVGENDSALISAGKYVVKFIKLFFDKDKDNAGQVKELVQEEGFIDLGTKGLSIAADKVIKNKKHKKVVNDTLGFLGAFIKSGKPSKESCTKLISSASEIAIIEYVKNKDIGDWAVESLKRTANVIVNRVNLEIDIVINEIVYSVQSGADRFLETAKQQLVITASNILSFAFSMQVGFELGMINRIGETIKAALFFIIKGDNEKLTIVTQITDAIVDVLNAMFKNDKKVLVIAGAELMLALLEFANEDSVIIELIKSFLEDKIGDDNDDDGEGKTDGGGQND